jgi:tRNA (adenine57-N1/adenine58-N1)-methyltransferase
VGPAGKVVSYEQREDFARRALANIHLRLGDVTNLIVRLQPVAEGLGDEQPVDRALFDLPEPWHLVEPVARVLRTGGIFLAYVPTIIQAQQVSEALRRHPGYALVETFETLFRPWNIDGLSVRPFHRMVAHTGFITVARRCVVAEGARVVAAPPEGERADDAP